MNLWCKSNWIWILSLESQWNQQKKVLEQLGHVFDIARKPQQSVRDIKIWVIFIFGNSVTNENENFNENENWRSDVG